MFTFTKFPLIKYTPLSIWNTEPVAAAAVSNVTARGVPAAIVEFPSNPEDKTSLQTIGSPSLKI